MGSEVGFLDKVVFPHLSTFFFKTNFCIKVISDLKKRHKYKEFPDALYANFPSVNISSYLLYPSLLHSLYEHIVSVFIICI